MHVHFQVRQAVTQSRAVLTKIGKPTEAEAHVLASLFPSSSRPPKRTYSQAFDPLADCVASSQKQKKKAARIKPRKILVVLMLEETTVLPRFSKRRALRKAGCIKQLEFMRNMSSQQVKNVIIRGFPEKFSQKENAKITFLRPEPKSHTLTKIERKDLDGEDTFELAGQGSLYIRLEVRHYFVQIQYDSHASNDAYTHSNSTHSPT